MRAEESRVLERLQSALGHRFADQGLLLRALTHRSVGGPNNERLEFLGDAVLNFAIARALFQRHPQADEGDLSRLRATLVRGESLSAIARALPLADALRLGGSELRSGGFRRASIMADALEALIGAVQIDAGTEAAIGVCERLFGEALAGLPDADELKDAKTRLQEWLQARGHALPTYQVLEEQGPPHQRRFRVSCALEDGRAAQAEGGSRKTAEQRAAARLLQQLEDAGA